MAPTKHMCKGCDKIIKVNSSRIRCIQCNEWFHKKCSGLENEAFNNLAKEFAQSSENYWSCDKCDSEISIVNVADSESESESESEDEIMDDNSEPPSRKMNVECMESLLSKHLEPLMAELRIIKENMVMKKDIHIPTSSKEDVKLHKTENTLTNDDPHDFYKTFGYALNKLKTLGNVTTERLQPMVENVFETAMGNSNFSAFICRELALTEVSVSAESNFFVSFRKLLVTRCQIEFDANLVAKSNRSVRLAEIAACTDPEKKKELMQNLDEEDRRLRMRSICNICFICELFKQRVVSINIMVHCLHRLMENDDEVQLERVCTLLSSIGKELEQRNVDFSKIFDQIHALLKREDGKVSNRIRFMLQNVINLRLGGWVPRSSDFNSKTVEQIPKKSDNDRNSIHFGKRGGCSSADQDDQGDQEDQEVARGSKRIKK